MEELNLPEYYLTKFSTVWSHLLPQLNHYLDEISQGEACWVDVTHLYKDTKCKLIGNLIKDGNNIFALVVRGAAGIIRKWETEKGKLKKVDGRPIIECNSSVVSTAILDVVTPFICTDEVLQAKHRRDKPYNLEVERVLKTFDECGADHTIDTIFLFITTGEKIRNTVTMFLEGLTFILSGDFKEKRGFLHLESPKWKSYHDERIDNLVFQFYQRGVMIQLSPLSAMKR